MNLAKLLADAHTFIASFRENDVASAKAKRPSRGDTRPATPLPSDGRRAIAVDVGVQNERSIGSLVYTAPKAQQSMALSVLRTLSTEYFVPRVSTPRRLRYTFL